MAVSPPASGVPGGRTVLVGAAVLLCLVAGVASGGSAGAVHGPPAPGPTALQADDVRPAVQIEDGGSYYLGQRLYRSAGVSAGETVRLVITPETGGSQSVFTRQVNASGTITFDTAAFADVAHPANYRLQDGNGNTIATFLVRRAQLDAQLEPREIPLEQAGELFIESNVGELEVQVSSPQLDQEVLAEMVGGRTFSLDADGQAVLEVLAHPDLVAPGEYTLRVSATEADVTAEVVMVVTEGTSTATPVPGTTAVPGAETTLDPQRAEELTAERQEAQRINTSGTATPDVQDGGDDRPKRGFIVNGEDDPLSALSNLLNLTMLGFVLSIVGILYQLMGGR